MEADETQSDPLVERAAAGDADAWGALLERHRQRLLRVVAFRLDRRLCGRLDPVDVIQEAFVAATARRAEFYAQSTQPLFLWLRWMVGNTLLELHRHHLGVKMRDPRREARPPGEAQAAAANAGDGSEDDPAGAAMAWQLSAGATGPVTAAGRAERKARLTEALRQMDATDRQVLAFRHFEQLTSAETAAVLGIQERAAAKRYLRALERLRQVLADMPGGLTEVRP